MATVANTDSYKGLAAGMFYTLMQGNGFTWSKYVNTLFNVDGKGIVLPSASHDPNPLRKPMDEVTSADLVAGKGSDVTFGERKLTVSELTYVGSIKPDEWLQYFREFQPNGAAVDLKANPKVLGTVLTLAMDAITTQIARLHAVGDTGGGDATLDFYNGFATIIKADPDTTMAGAHGVITKANVIERIKVLKKAIPSRLAFHPDLYAFCSKATFELYHEARAESQTYIPAPDVKPTDKLVPSLGSALTLVPIDAMPDDFVFATVASTKPSSNLVQGFWAKGDSTSLKLFKLNEASKNYTILLRMYTGVQYKSGKDIFYIDKVAKPD